MMAWDIYVTDGSSNHANRVDRAGGRAAVDIGKCTGYAGVDPTHHVSIAGQNNDEDPSMWLDGPLDVGPIYAEYPYMLGSQDEIGRRAAAAFSTKADASGDAVT